MHLTVLGIGLLAVVLLSIDELPRDIKHWLRVVIWSVTVVFFLEYLVRLWVAPEIIAFRPAVADHGPRALGDLRCPA